jgi:hypothetical protein
MSSKGFEVGDRVRVVESGFSHGPGNRSGLVGVVRSVDKSRRRTEPFYIYYVEMPGEEKLVDFEYRELESVAPVSEEPGVKD